MRWSEISAQQPALGTIADRLLIEPGVLLAGTIRRDGTARISEVHGTARAVTEQDRQERYAAAVREQIGWQPVLVSPVTVAVVDGCAPVTVVGSAPRPTDRGSPYSR